jgi:cytochrome c-type biogenesis protein
MEVETVPLLLAFGAGLASFLSPCHLAVVPAFLGFLTGTAAGSPGAATADRWLLVRRAGLFVLGFSLALVALGISVGLVGYLVWDRLPLLRKVGGVLLLVFGLHTLGLLRLSVLYRELRWAPHGRLVEGRWGGLLLGLVFGFGWTPCVGPVLAAILLLAAESATVWSGGLLLAVYAAGLGLPFLGAALLLGRLRQVVAGLRRYSRSVEYATGTLLLVMGVTLYTNQLQRVVAFMGAWSPL